MNTRSPDRAMIAAICLAFLVMLSMLEPLGKGFGACLTGESSFCEGGQP
jgi:hypothetical protein